MKRGQQVFCARMVDGEVRVVSAFIADTVHRHDHFVTVKPELFVGARPSIRDLHATRTAALGALAERLEQQATDARRKATEMSREADRLSGLARKAEEMAR